MNYLKNDEFRIFGSDLNKFIHNLSKEMTCINADCIQYKASKHELRLIESKHENEKIPYAQLRVLELIDNLFKLSINPTLLTGVYVVKGDYPYTFAKITRLRDAKIKIIENKKFVDWLEFKLNFDEL